MNGSNLIFKKQQGTALITVVLIAAVVIVMVIESVKTVKYQKQLSSNLINRDQAFSYLLGMEELAKIYLKKAFENTEEDTVHLGQLWAQEDITFPIDGGGMTATIRDMQSCFNLNALLKPSSQGSGERGGGERGGEEEGSPRSVNEGLTASSNSRSSNEDDSGRPSELTGVKVLEVLIDKVKPDSSVIGKDLTAAFKDWMDEDIEPTGAEGAEDDYYQGLEIPYRTANSQIAHESELLTIKGFNREIYFALRPLICVLPDDSINEVNVNTVSAESATLLYAIIDANNSSATTNINEGDVSKAISERPEEGYESISDFVQAMGLEDTQSFRSENLTVTSAYFEMRAKAEIGKTRVEMKTLFKKDEDKNFTVVSRYFGRE